MNVKILLVGISTCVALLGCSSTSVKPIQVETVQVQRMNLNLPNPEPLALRQFHWVVITPDNATKVFKDLEKKKQTPVLFGLTDDGYKNLAMNISEIRSYMIQQQGIIKTYRDYYESPVIDNQSN